MTQAPDTHLVERAGLGKYFDRGPEASEERWQCSIVLTPNGGIGVVAKYGWRANEFGYPEPSHTQSKTACRSPNERLGLSLRS